MADKLGIYNKALIRAGSAVLTALTDDRDEADTLDALWDNGAVDYCLEVTKPQFARVTIENTGTATTGGVTLAYTHTLPSDYVTIIDVYSDSQLDQRVTRYINDGNTLICDYETIYLRYVQNDLAESTYTSGFVEVLAKYLARELSATYKPDRYTEIDGELQALSEGLSGAEDAKEPERATKEGGLLTDAWRHIYNDALLILGKGHQKIVSGDMDHPYRSALDTALDSELIANVMEDTGWQFGVDSAKIDYDPNTVPEWGYQYAFDKPDNLQRKTGIYTDEYLTQPLKNYTEEGDYYFADVTTIYLTFIATDWNSNVTAWPSYFKRLVAAQLAKDTANSINPNMAQAANEEYKERKHNAKNNDAIQSPPQRIRTGTWLNARASWFHRNNG